MAYNGLTISATINTRQVARNEVLAWEAKRIPRAARTLGLPVPTGTLERQRNALCESKLDLGPVEIRHRLARHLRFSDAIARVTSRASRGRRALSVCDLQVEGGSAQQFVDWFADTDRDDYAHSMVLANPDHFLIDTAADGSQEVIETTGGSPFATRFFVDYQDTEPLITPRELAFPLELAGVARTGTGMAIGGVRHQLRDTANGFHMRACVEFPRLMAPHMITQHRLHLACEFGNWIEAAFAD